MTNTCSPALMTRFITRQEALMVGLTDQDLHSRDFHRLFRSIYVSSQEALTHGLRCEASWLLIPQTAILAGPSAAWQLGAKLASATDDVHLLIERDDHFGPIKGMRIHTSDTPIDEVVTVDGHRVTAPLKTAWDLGRWLKPVDSVMYIDRMLRNRLFTAAGLAAYADPQPSIRGSRRARRVIELVDGRAESPAESRIRLLIAMAGLPAPEPQFVVRHNGRFVARVDLGWESHLLALEYDGVHHADAAQMAGDRDRLNRLQAAGWTILHATSKHAYGSDFPQLERQIRRCLQG